MGVGVVLTPSLAVLIDPQGSSVTHRLSLTALIGPGGSAAVFTASLVSAWGSAAGFTQPV